MNFIKSLEFHVRGLMIQRKSILVFPEKEYNWCHERQEIPAMWRAGTDIGTYRDLQQSLGEDQCLDDPALDFQIVQNGCCIARGVVYDADKENAPSPLS